MEPPRPEMENLQGKVRKRAGSILQPPPKRTKQAVRPAWISQQTATAVRRDGENENEEVTAALTWDVVAASEADTEEAEAAGHTEDQQCCNIFFFNIV